MKPNIVEPALGLAKGITVVLAHADTALFRLLLRPTTRRTAYFSAILLLSVILRQLVVCNILFWPAVNVLSPRKHRLLA